MTASLRVNFQQSEANNPDVEVIRRLLANYSNLTHLQQIRRLGGGYTCRAPAVMDAVDDDIASGP